MNCRDARHAMKEALEMGVDHPERQSAGPHLQVCAGCRQEWEQLLRLDGMLREAPPVNVPEDVRERLLKALAIRGEALARKQGQYAHRAWRYALGAAGLLGVVAIGVVLMTAPRMDVLAEITAAMAQVKTVHANAWKPDTGEVAECWLSVDHGWRKEYDGTVVVVNSEGHWFYSPEDNTVRITDSEIETMADQVTVLSGMTYLQGRDPTAPGGECVVRKVSDVVVDGAAMKRLDVATTRMAEVRYQPGVFRETNLEITLWVDPETMRVVDLEGSMVDTEGNDTSIGRLHMEYDMELDPGLFAFEPPAEATITDLRQR